MSWLSKFAQIVETSTFVPDATSEVCSSREVLAVASFITRLLLPLSVQFYFYSAFSNKDCLQVLSRGGNPEP